MKLRRRSKHSICKMIVKCVSCNNFQVQSSINSLSVTDNRQVKQAVDITCLAKYSDEMWSYGLET